MRFFRPAKSSVTETSQTPLSAHGTLRSELDEPGQLPKPFMEAVTRIGVGRARYEAGALTKSQFAELLQQIVVTADDGSEWMMGATSGRWYKKDPDGMWISELPPVLKPAGRDNPDADAAISGGGEGGGHEPGVDVIDAFFGAAGTTEPAHQIPVDTGRVADTEISGEEWAASEDAHDRWKQRWQPAPDPGGVPDGGPQGVAASPPDPAGDEASGHPDHHGPTPIGDLATGPLLTDPVAVGEQDGDHPSLVPAPLPHSPLLSSPAHHGSDVWGSAHRGGDPTGFDAAVEEDRTLGGVAADNHETEQLGWWATPPASATPEHRPADPDDDPGTGTASVTNPYRVDSGTGGYDDALSDLFTGTTAPPTAPTAPTNTNTNSDGGDLVDPDDPFLTELLQDHQ